MLFSRDLHVLSLPKTVDAFLVYPPVAFHQQAMDALGSEAWTLPSQSTHFTKQLRLIVRPARLVTLCVARLTEDTARATLRHFLRPQTDTWAASGPSRHGDLDHGTEAIEKEPTS